MKAVFSRVSVTDERVCPARGLLGVSPSSIRNGTGRFCRGLCVLLGGERLPCQFRAEVLLRLRYEIFLAAGVDEGVRAPGFHLRILFFHAEVSAVGSEENIAGQ